MKRYCCIAILLIALLVFPGEASTDDAITGSDDFAAAQKTTAALRVPKGLSIEVFAAKPQLFNPVAICVDDRGRIYVAEDHRFLEGTPENRTHNFMLEDDLQVTTLEDRLAMQKKWAGKFKSGKDWFTQKSDIVRRLEDKDGDGRADTATVFAAGFDGPLDGLGSGLIARDGKVWYTCIPNLWLLEDKDDDGKAELKTPLLTGFGVNAAFYGHDLHGLVWGVDGKLYFSVGDRGAHVLTKEGTTISNPRNGGVFRCNPDGTELELIHRGLRNPQELAIDQYGNLFADDNNCDKGDYSRLVYVVPGGDSGWNMAYQHIDNPYLTGPWHAEGMWHLSHKLQPAYVTPPVAKIGAGPSGFTFSAGTSLPARYQNHFFYCNYTGNGGVESFAVEVAGASFKIADHHDFCKPLNASDIEFGYDGKMYVADYASSPWDRNTTGGRIYTVFDSTRVNSDSTKQTMDLFRTGFGQQSLSQLANLLHHDDMRVRLRAQFELVTRDGAGVVLTKIAEDDNNQLARLHGIWGLGQLARQTVRKQPAAVDLSELLRPVVALLADGDIEVRSQSAKLLGELRYSSAANSLLPLLKDGSARVRFFAAVALGSLKHEPSLRAIFDMLRENDGQDRYLTHAGVVALEQIGNRQAVQLQASDPAAAIRMAVLLVQRRWKDVRILQFLDDAELSLVTEAARVVNDLPLEAGREALANLAARYRNTPGDDVVPLMRRIINANFQIGRAHNIEAVVRIATSREQTNVVRSEAIAALSDWPGPTKRDRVNGFWRPVPARDAREVQKAVEANASSLLANTTADLQIQATGLLTRLKVNVDDTEFARWVTEGSRSADARIAAVRLLASRKYPGLSSVLESAVLSDQPQLRAEARDQLVSVDQKRATTLLSVVLGEPQATIQEKQRAIAGLARIESDAAFAILDGWAERLRINDVPAALQLDLLEAFQASTSPPRATAVRAFQERNDKADPLSTYRAALTGGNAEVGRELFVSHRTAQCIRCHSANNVPATGKHKTGKHKTGKDKTGHEKAGPNLAQVAGPEGQHDRRYLLESIVTPNAKIAKGYGSVTLVLNNGKVLGGRVKAEDKLSITILTAENVTRRIERAAIEQQVAAPSAMPDMTKLLSLRQMRDLVEYLSTLK
ncbi:MAG: quinoprotein glucose dehydrogenase [Pirellulaceae bacterium]|jgi:quinoprotein glucose dehydrogenase